jgi:hypothetical protein
VHDPAWLDGAGDYVDVAQQAGGGHERQTTSRLSIWTSATLRQGHVDALDRIASLSEGAAPVKDVRGDGQSQPSPAIYSSELPRCLTSGEPPGFHALVRLAFSYHPWRVRPS